MNKLENKYNDPGFKKLKSLLVVSEIPDTGLFCEFHKVPMVECDRHRTFTKFCYADRNKKKSLPPSDNEKKE